MPVRENAKEQVVVSFMVSKLTLSKAQTCIFQSQHRSMAVVLVVLEPAWKKATKWSTAWGWGKILSVPQNCVPAVRAEVHRLLKGHHWALCWHYRLLELEPLLSLLQVVLSSAAQYLSGILLNTQKYGIRKEQQVKTNEGIFLLISILMYTLI